MVLCPTGLIQSGHGKVILCRWHADLWYIDGEYIYDNKDINFYKYHDGQKKIKTIFF